MEWYIEAERLLLSPFENPEAVSLRPMYESAVQNLYKAILKFQILSVVRFSQSRTGRLGQDMIQLHEWTKMADEVKELASVVEQKARSIREILSWKEGKPRTQGTKGIKAAVTMN